MARTPKEVTRRPRRPGPRGGTTGDRREAGVAHILLIVACVVVLVLLIVARPAGEKKGDAKLTKVKVTSSVPAGIADKYNQREQLLDRGQRVYNKYCVGCHGASGDGNGVATERLIVKPRDFTKGVYKFRSTKQLQLPLEADLHRTITQGLPGVSMPGFPLMPEADRTAVIQYIKAFYSEWDDKAKARQTVHVPRAPQDLNSPERVGRGRVVYLAMQCGKCHGTDGAGSKASIAVVDDATLGPIKPRNFTRSRFLGGDDPEDIYRTFHTGLAGAMPNFDESVLVFVNAQTALGQKDYFEEGEEAKLKPFLDQMPADPAAIASLDDAKKRELVERHSWDLVSYIYSLRQGGGKPTGAPMAAKSTPVVQPKSDEDEFK